MPANYCKKIILFFKFLFHKKQKVKHPKHYHEEDITGTGYTFTPSFLNDRFNKSK